jgi:SAM-dependent methyltransferase
MVGGEAHPFDAVAAEYDDRFSSRRLGRWLREAVWQRLEPLFQPGDQVLELGCGTGEDALWLARRGCRVTATDASTAMLAIAQQKAEAAGLRGAITFQQLDLGRLLNRQAGRALGSADGPPSNQFDGALSNFGALNCLADRRPLAAWLAEMVRPGGRVALVVMGPCCPWEVAWHLAHGQLHSATRRFRPGGRAALGAGAGLRVWYPSPRRLRAELEPHFRLRGTQAIGVLLPPGELAHLVDRWPRAFARLASLERRLCCGGVWSWLSDHYLAIFERHASG